MSGMKKLLLFNQVNLQLFLRLEQTWAKVSIGIVSSNLLRLYVGKWSIGYNYLIQTRYILFVLFRLQAKRTACERLIGAAVASGVDTSVSENVQGNVKRLSNVIQHLIDDVERQLQSVDSTFYSSSIFSETLVHRNGSVGRPKLVINLTQIDYLRSWQFTWTRICHALTLK